MKDCLFCRILAGEIPSQKVYEDDLTYAFRDIHPMAPVHVLVVPRTHVTSLNEVNQLPAGVLEACLKSAAHVAEAEGIGESGWRLVSNCGSDACQSVPHLHFHVLGGRKMEDSMA